MITYSLVVNDCVPQEAPRWFYVNPNYGNITVIGSLQDDQNNRVKYIVRNANKSHILKFTPSFVRMTEMEFSHAAGH